MTGASCIDDAELRIPRDAITPARRKRLVVGYRSNMSRNSLA
jgi:hypothetical protein